MIPLHPRIVHFPVALLIIAGLFAILAISFKGKREIFKEVLFWNLLLGTGFALLAILSGFQEEKILAHNDAIHEILKLHELFGKILTGVFILLTAWLLVRKAMMKIGELIVFTLILLVCSGMLGYSSHLGGTMVYKHGAGILPMKEIINKGDHDHQNGHGSEDHETVDQDMHDHDSHPH